MSKKIKIYKLIGNTTPQEAFSKKMKEAIKKNTKVGDDFVFKKGENEIRMREFEIGESLENKSSLLFRVTKIKEGKKNSYIPSIYEQKGTTISTESFAYFEKIMDEGLEFWYYAPFGDCRSIIDDSKIDASFALDSVLEHNGKKEYKNIEKINLISADRNATRKSKAAPTMKQMQFDKNSDFVTKMSINIIDNLSKKMVEVSNYISFSTKRPFDKIGNDLKFWHSLYKKSQRSATKKINEFLMVRNKELNGTLFNLLLNVICNENSDGSSYTVYWPQHSDDHIISFKISDSKDEVSIIDNSIIKNIDLKDRKKILSKKITAVFESEQMYSFPLKDCISYSCTYNKKRYILFNGIWLEISAAFEERINEEYISLNEYIDKEYKELIEWEEGVGAERLYNAKVSKDPSNFLINTDEILVQLEESNQKFELADTIDLKNKVLITTKHCKNAAPISHFSTQATIIMEMLEDNPEYLLEIFKKREQKIIEKNSKITDNLDIGELFNNLDFSKYNKVILGVAYESLFKKTDGEESSMPHMPFMGRLAMVKLFKQYGNNNKISLRISLIKRKMKDKSK